MIIEQIFQLTSDEVTLACILYLADTVGVDPEADIQAEYIMSCKSDCEDMEFEGLRLSLSGAQENGTCDCGESCGCDWSAYESVLAAHDRVAEPRGLENSTNERSGGEK